jgi:hypothetical protein
MGSWEVAMELLKLALASHARGLVGKVLSPGVPKSSGLEGREVHHPWGPAGCAGMAGRHVGERWWLAQGLHGDSGRRWWILKVEPCSTGAPFLTWLLPSSAPPTRASTPCSDFPSPLLLSCVPHSTSF